MIEGVGVGDVVRVTQTITWGNRENVTSVEGVVRRMGEQKTGSWFAHGKDDKLWLDRLELERADGETVVVNLDRQSRVEKVGGGGWSGNG